MLNGLLDFGPDDGLQGFVGGGVGVSRGKLANDLVNDSDTGFAWQAIAGVRYPLTTNVDVSLKYRFFNQDDRSEEHTSELQSLMRISYAVFCLKKKNK